MSYRNAWSTLPAIGLILISGCGSPNKVNIELRKTNQSMETELSALHKQVDAQRQMIDGLQASRTSAQQLPPDELKKLFVAYGIKFARLTGGADLDPTKPGDEAVRVYITPTDEHGDTIQAAGSFVIEAFDLEGNEPVRIGRWEMPTIEARKHWEALLLDSAYVLTCPWQTVPRHPSLTVRATFTDELTHASFTIQKPVTVNPPPVATSQPVQ